MVWGFSSSFSFYVALIIWHSGIANIKLALCLQPRIAESFILPAGRLDCTEKNSQEGALLSGWATKQARSKRVDVTRSKELSNETPSNDDSARKWGRYRGRSSRPRARTMGWSPSSTSAQENTLDAVLRGIFEEIPWAGNPQRPTGKRSPIPKRPRFSQQSQSQSLSSRNPQSDRESMVMGHNFDDPSAWSKNHEDNTPWQFSPSTRSQSTFTTWPPSDTESLTGAVDSTAHAGVKRKTQEDIRSSSFPERKELNPVFQKLWQEIPLTGSPPWPTGKRSRLSRQSHSQSFSSARSLSDRELVIKAIDFDSLFGTSMEFEDNFPSHLSPRSQSQSISSPPHQGNAESAEEIGHTPLAHMEEKPRDDVHSSFDLNHPPSMDGQPQSERASVTKGVDHDVPLDNNRNMIDNSSPDIYPPQSNSPAPHQSEAESAAENFDPTSPRSMDKKLRPKVDFDLDLNIPPNGDDHVDVPPRTTTIAPNDQFNLNLPDGFDLNISADTDFTSLDNHISRSHASGLDNENRRLNYSYPRFRSTHGQNFA
ncbi:hypothetical protein MJO28_000873 [Puccinia striiformis f. sp. tritici]|uniref:Uncharacterized protein n=1 Tax=Puccinia striiformis f. sp. tritici TaxID=168172 RepID=A0ACC0F112_9BASI|nr:hypothetical protein Pst134EA_000377 [Puccinia striiformis f. sp. tritici]KAH9473305.1 hypothetical protein Pst134EA_000377 [Puccinia striiformis f. sp. tritici]KAI7962779.1 hypothetical protein MJO28_000873 [Puccinia striiformis f. sp. tritici]